jgi:hypothetical protein
MASDRTLSSTVLAMAVAAATTLGACSQGTDNGAPVDSNGSITLALQAGNATISSVSYSISGPASFSTSGTIDVSNSTTLATVIGPLPAGSGFSITLNATSTDGSESCTGSAGFMVTAHATTPVSVHLLCHQGARSGSVLVNGTLNVCPVIDALSASTVEVLVGGSVGLTATAHDSDSGPSPLSYHWTSTGGVFTDAGAPTTRFSCTSPGSVTITLTASDGDPVASCADTSSVTVTCTAVTASTGCSLGNGAGPIKHVIYLQFDNVHLRRDRPLVPSDLESMPHLLNFIRSNGTLMANDHTILISHTAGGILSTLTGTYPDRTGQTVSNSYVRTSATGTFSFISSFSYWTDPVSGSVPNVVGPDGSNIPAPWVGWTRRGCDVGAVASENMVLENTSTSSTGEGDVFKVFGAGSPQFMEAQTSAAAMSGTAARALAQTDFVGFAVHCAQGSALCASGHPDLLPSEPGGYTGFNGLFGAKEIDPVLTGQPASVPLTSMLGNPIVDPFGQPGFPGFDGMFAEVTLRYVASMQEAGIPVTYAYISDAHDNHGNAGSIHVAYGPGDPGYEAQLALYDQAFANFFTELANHGIDKSNTLFVVTVDEGDHFVGGSPTDPNCDGSAAHPCIWPTSPPQVGEITANIDTLVSNEFPSLAATFLGSGPDAFTVHADDAPTFYLAKKGTGGGALGQLDPDTRNFERTIAGLTAVNPYTGATDQLLLQYADQTGMKAMHMFTTGDPVRNPTFVYFADADYFFSDSSSTCLTCIGPAFAWNHGDIQTEIGQTWVGFVGPGVANLPDQVVFTDHTDVRSTINALTGARDSYVHDGRAITQLMVPGAVPVAIAGSQATTEALAASYKAINAPFGQFSLDMLAASTKALQGADPGDTIYTNKEASIASLTAQRDALAAPIRAGFDGAAFGSQTIDPVQAASWISQASALLASADALAAAP